MWGLKDAPRDFSMRLSRSLKEIVYQQGITDKQIWRMTRTRRRHLKTTAASVRNMSASSPLTLMTSK
eukprot:9018692-Prorocentrum_lima.AAC.1